MRHRTIPVALCSLSLLFVASLALSQTAEESISLLLPKGDPAAGRETFITLGCPSCHRVANDDKMPQRVSANPGPTLSHYQSQQEASRLALSILDPSHDFSGAVRHPQEGSPMPDFTRTMTVHQFIDLIAYLQSL